MVGIGEVFGGGVAPALAGYIAQHYGIEKTLYLALAGAVLGLLVAVCLRETAPASSQLRQQKSAEPL
ncbi:hypothetical protein D3C78_1689330 [compost metagenome]